MELLLLATGRFVSLEASRLHQLAQIHELDWEAFVGLTEFVQLVVFQELEVKALLRLEQVVVDTVVGAEE